jgi:hypothetical protein
MKRVSVLFLALCVIFLAAKTAEARALKMVFWYPGEAGTTEEGQPVIDAFLDYLSGKLAPDKISGRYVNSADSGISYIRKEKPVIGIVSYSAWSQHKGEFPGATVILSTLPLPAGKRLEFYELVGREDKIPANAQILWSEPLSPGFIRAELFPLIPGDATFSQTPQMIFKLKEIGEGRNNSIAILTPTEAATLARVSAAWAKGVKTITKSKPVPTARAVLFDSAFDATKLKAALVGAAADPKAQEILEELRLKGFSE